MNCKKCDRCGKTYEKPDYRKALVLLANGMTLVNDIIDLCPDCSADFLRWKERTQKYQDIFNNLTKEAADE